MPHKIYECCDSNSCSCGRRDREGYDAMFKSNTIRKEREKSKKTKKVTTKNNPIGELALAIQGAIDTARESQERLDSLIAEYRSYSFTGEDMRNLVVRKWINEIEEALSEIKN